ncbi:type IV secretory pathway VirB9-like protein [Novosphingobium sp. PhB165]|uniref:TrbG/VirB9 family P-type conjugative transfer protein n=1 Tax=Novosphingobium sp. PhB165 TaxID=2485105 RepID=UPI00104F5896|nr:TrbG/VirB9 family P-type conjugative transfer protein [Novosphingobium sp. PhB165]TCM15080.1 type IV secretory pathway VirB9-like protein [Novosphingobium sp. PhB165]
MRSLALLLVLAAGAASAQELPAIDPRIVALPVTGTGLLSLRTASDVTQTLMFRQGEQIVSVILSDPTGFNVMVSGAGDSLALRAMRPSAFGVMSVRTNMRSYEFELTAGTPQSVPAVVRLVNPPPPSFPVPPVMQAGGGSQQSTYRLSGNKTLLPTSIRDDGAKTYIEWKGDRAMPATFALGPTGNEQMVDGYVRGGVYTIDRVYETLIFRIDKEHARATRVSESKARG